MSMRWVAFLVFLWITTAILADVMAGSEALLGGHGESTQLSYLTTWLNTITEEDWGIMQMPGFVAGFFSMLWNVMLFQAARETFLSGWASIIVWIVLVPIIVAAVWGLVSAFIAVLQRALST